MSKIGVIGAGIIGVCIGHFLNKSGHEVILFDENEPGSQTSFGNAGLFANHECVTANSPHLWKNIPKMLFDKNSPIVVDWFYMLKNLPWGIKFLRNCTTQKTEHIAKSLSDFSSHAMLAYEEIFNEINLTNIMVKKEPIFLYESKKLFENNQYSLSLRKKHNVKYEIINKEEISKIEPNLEPIYYNGIILKGERYTKSPLEVTKKIFDHFINNGGFFNKSKVELIYKKENSFFLKFKNKEESFNKIIIAAGARSNFLANLVGDNFPLDVERGYHITFENSKDLIKHPIGWAKTGFYMTPMTDGIRAAGTVEIAGMKKPMNKNILNLIEKTSRSLLPQLGKVKSRWMGFRPTLTDSLPVIGESQKCKNLFYAFGHQHLGLSLGAITAKVMQSLIEKKPTNINIEPLRTNRF